MSTLPAFKIGKQALDLDEIERAVSAALEAQTNSFAAVCYYIGFHGVKVSGFTVVNERAMRGHGYRLELGNPLLGCDVGFLEVKNVKLNASPIAAFALHGALQRVERPAPHVNLAIQANTFRHASEEPCRRAEKLAVARVKIVAVPNAADSIQLFAGEVIAEIGRNFVHGRRMPDSHQDCKQ